MLRHRLKLRPLVVLHPAVGFALVTLTCVVMGWLLTDTWTVERREAEQQETNIAATLERTIERTLSTLDLSLRAAVTGLSIPGIATVPQAARQAILFDGALTAEGLGSVFIIDEQGLITEASRGDGRRGDSRADRDYFRMHRDDPGRGLLITGPLQGRVDNEWTIVLSRRINHPDGSFAGVVAGGLHLSFFDSLFQSLDLSPYATVTLLSAEGRLLARRPQDASNIGRDLRGGPVFEHLTRDPRGGVFEGMMRLDDIERLVAYRQIGDFPLTVAVGFSKRVIYAGWLHTAEIFALVVLLLGGLDILLGRALRRELRERSRAERAARAARAEAELLAAELSRSLRRLEALINNSVDAMVVARVDALGNFTYEAVNPVWEELTGVCGALAAGQSPRACLPGPWAEAVIAAWDECVRSRGTVAFSFRRPGAEREQCWDAVVCPVIEVDGSIQRVIGTARNVTSHRLLEAKLREVHRMEAVGGLTAAIAHDFNNLLQAMLGALEVAGEDGEFDAERRSAIGLAGEAGRRAASLVHQLLAFSRKQMLLPAPLSPDRVLGEIAVALRPMLGSQHRLTTQIVGEVGPVTADIVQLNRCLTDLILNGRDAMQRGGPLRLLACAAGPEEAAEAGLNPGGYIRFTVEDEGVGMPAETLSRAFEPFFTTKAIGKGTGLGLSMVQGFARQSGGDVTIESAVGVGTAVSLWLPRLPGASTHGATRLAPPKPAHPASGVGPCRILLVDDEAPVRQTLVLFLRKAGHAAVAVESGKAALALIAGGEAFDLLITDQSMPGMAGTDLIAAVAQFAPSLPAMLITGFDRVAGVEHLAARVEILAKPFARAVFLHHVAALLAPDRPLSAAA